MKVVSITRKYIADERDLRFAEMENSFDQLKAKYTVELLHRRGITSYVTIDYDPEVDIDDNGSPYLSFFYNVSAEVDTLYELIEEKELLSIIGDKENSLDFEEMLESQYKISIGIKK